MAVQAESAPHDTAVSQRQPIQTLSTGGSEVLTALSAVLCLDCKCLPVCLQSSCQCAGQMRRGTLAWWCCHQSSPAAAGRLPALSSCCMSCWSTRSLLQTGGPPQLDLAMPLTTRRPLPGSCHEESPYVFSRSLLAGLCTCHRPEQCHCLPARSLPGLQEQAQSGGAPKLLPCRAAAWRVFQLETTCMPMLNVLGLLGGRGSTSQHQARNGLRLAGTSGLAQHLAPAAAKSAVAGRVFQAPPVALPASSADAPHLHQDVSGSRPPVSHAEGAERLQAEQDSTAAADAEVSRVMASAPGPAAPRQPAGQLGLRPGRPLWQKSRAGQAVILYQWACHLNEPEPGLADS